MSLPSVYFPVEMFTFTEHIEKGFMLYSVYENFSFC